MSASPWLVIYLGRLLLLLPFLSPKLNDWKLFKHLFLKHHAVLSREYRVASDVSVCAYSVMSDSLWPHDCSLPGSSVHEILQTRILEQAAISYSRGLSWPKDQTHVSCISCLGRRILYHCTTWASSLDVRPVLKSNFSLWAERSKLVLQGKRDKMPPKGYSTQVQGGQTPWGCLGDLARLVHWLRWGSLVVVRGGGYISQMRTA